MSALLLALVALGLLLSPSLSSASPSPPSPPHSPAPPTSPSSLLAPESPSPAYPPRAESDPSQHDSEESIENRGEAQARSMQQRYAQDAALQQRQQTEQERARQRDHIGHHSHQSQGGVDRNATVVTGDDLRHPRDPKQQQKQQAEVRKHGDSPQPTAEQTSDRRDDEAEKAERAEDVAAHNQPTPTPTVTEENNNGTVRGSRRPFGHSAQPHAHTHDDSDDAERGAEGGEQEEEGEEEKSGSGGDASAFHPLHNATQSRLNQTSPWHSTDPQARTWSHQQQPRLAPPLSNSSSTHNSSSSPTTPTTTGYGYAPGEYNSSSPLSHSLPVPSVDHAQAKVDAQARRHAQQSLPANVSDSGSDADDELGLSEGEEGEEGEAALSTGGLQQPGNALELQLSERRGGRGGSSKPSHVGEDIHDPHNGGLRLRDEARGGKASPHEHGKGGKGKRREEEEDERFHVEAERQRETLAQRGQLQGSEGGEGEPGVGWGWLPLLMVLSVLVGAGVVGYVWVRRVRAQQSYEEVQQFDAYGDLVEGETGGDEVQLRVY